VDAKHDRWHNHGLINFKELLSIGDYFHSLEVVIIFGSIQFLSKKSNQTEIKKKKTKPVQTDQFDSVF
jgi:hypothetical protein